MKIVKREIYYGMKPDGKKVLFLIEYNQEWKCTVYTIKMEFLSRELKDTFFNEWAKPPYPNFEMPDHDHIIWDLTMSPVFPFLSAIDRPLDRDNLSRSARRALTRQYSHLYSDILLSEIEFLEVKVACQRPWDYQVDLVHQYWNTAMALSNKMKEARSKYNTADGNAWREQLTHEDFQILKERLDKIFSALKELRTKHSMEQDKTMENNARLIEQELSAINYKIENTSDWKEVRAALKTFREKVTSTKLTRENQHKFFDSIGKTFDRIRELEQHEYRKYENECDLFYRRLSADLSIFESEVRNTVNWRETREKLKQFQIQIKESKLKKDKRNELSQRLNSAFETLGNRQSDTKARFEKDCALSSSRLESKVSRCESLARNSVSWNDARSEFKSVASEIRESILTKERRTTFFERIDWCFKKLGERQDTDKNQYESECFSNYRNIVNRLSRCSDSISYSKDFRSIREELSEIRDNIKSAKLKKDQRQELFDTLNYHFDSFKRIQDQHYDQMRREREEKRHSVLQNLQEKLDRLRGSTQHDEGVLADKEAKYENVRSGPKYHEIRDHLHNSIASLQEKIRSKHQSIRELEEKIVSIEQNN